MRAIVASWMAAWVLAGGAAGQPVEVGPVPRLRNASGLAPGGAGAVLAVSDAKVTSDQARFVLVDVSNGESLPLVVEWGEFGPTHDLEGICGVPGVPGEYLATESGVADAARGGFVYRVSLDRDEGNNSRVRCLERYSLPSELRGEGPDGVEREQIEGIVAWRAGERLMVLLGERVGGDLLIAELGEEGFGAATRMSTSHVARRRDRAITDLCLVPGVGGSWLVAAQSDDPGDSGPFGSTLVRLGWLTRSGVLLVGDGAVLAECEGLKVEGLCVPEGGDGGVLVLGTDDEDYGSIVRTLRLGVD